MTVVDKYRPVDTTPSTLTAPLPVMLGLMAIAAVLVLFGGDTLRREAVFQEHPPAVEAVMLSVADVGDQLGLTALRRTLDAWTAPLDDTARLLRRSYAAPEDDDQPTVVEPTEPTAPPGERWAARATRRAIHRILIVGASSIQYAVGTELERVLDERYDVELLRKGKVATGLARPDVFDWPAEVRRLVDEFHPDLVIGQFGGNDGQPLLDPAGKPLDVYTDGWAAEYTRRITELAGIVHGANARLMLVGMPIMRSEQFSRKVRWLNEITADAVTAAGGLYMETYDLAADASGAYRADVVVDGRSSRMRLDDGIHFTRAGGLHVARGMAVRLAQTVLLLPDAPPPNADGTQPPRPAAAYPLQVPASPRREASRLLAFVPPDVPTEGLPVWFLLHGAYDDWTAWSEHAHAELADLSARHDLVIVLPDGERFGYWLDSPIDPTHQLASWFWEDLVPFVDRTLPSDGRRAISGLSMGGHGALALTLDHPDRVVAATSMSGAVDLTRSTIAELADALGPKETSLPNYERASVLYRLRAAPHALDGVTLHLSVALDDRWAAPNEELHALLEAAGVDHGWSTVARGGHAWPVWREALPEHARVVAGALRPVTAAEEPPSPAEGP